ncbi:NAD(P)-binding protein [Thozetella sp. PMI_491]|nr:NAD(P)-binding protein [Thozetella sp. PMI_491]
MPSYLITGAARGLGFEFMRQLSENPDNTVIGLVRDKDATEKKVAVEIRRENIHILEADVTEHGALKKASETVSQITGGTLDYLISNAGIGRKWSMMTSMADLSTEPERLEEELLDHYKVNAIGAIHLFCLFVPLILNGRAKKVIAISSCMGDLDFTRVTDLSESGPYGLSKAALNMVIAKFSAQYRSEGVLFMSICPGVVATDVIELDSDVEVQKFNNMAVKFKKYKPDWNGPQTPEASISAVLSVIKNSSLENGDAGSYISYTGSSKWL